ncbi:hypothetical protein ACJ73_05573 [Blastomyces percursus]|uniref:Uncharacterized protein n=1 Tax=Blastomyces percursus TaxID=1658174 RepID=A0A1J9R4Z1_9EURO|nr:hypothetical protein ACJ73_05573 [Blastomyces percursus]
MEDTHGLVNVNEAPAWLRTMLELQQQQVAEMRASQQRQYEELQRLVNQATPSSTTSSSVEPVIPPMSTDSLKERLGTPATFDASDPSNFNIT